MNNLVKQPVPQLEDFIPIGKAFQSIEDIGVFLLKVDDFKGRWALACKELGISTYAVKKLFKEKPEYRQMVERMRSHHQELYYQKLEQKSERNAEEDHRVTERIFQLNALNPAKYKPKNVGGVTNNIQINTTSLQIGDRSDYMQKVHSTGGKKKVEVATPDEQAEVLVTKSRKIVKL